MTGFKSGPSAINVIEYVTLLHLICHFAYQCPTKNSFIEETIQDNVYHSGFEKVYEPADGASDAHETL